ncbi:DUF6115 domain-containing protein [Rossellomorea aquimaris]|uniref:DUF6115 domain-containing protein n=1 Tax=Rossellomorea aquimaris TaxID=189382 RepID=UPI0005C8D0D1|nr:hypothetical protein [Rossellomorea aquimaris]
MVTFLLFISFLLNIVSLLAIVILYSRQNRFLNMEKDHKKMISELEAVISTYLMEMKEENEEFLRTFTNHANSQTQISDKPSDENINSSPLQTNPKWTGAGYKQASKAYQQKTTPRGTDEKKLEMKPTVRTNEDPFTQQVLSLKREGLTIEEIAQTVGKGKTEIELLLKFRQIM